MMMMMMMMMIVLVSATGDEDVVNPSQEPIETASDPLIIGPAVAAVVLIVIIMQVTIHLLTFFITYNFIHHKVAKIYNNGIILYEFVVKSKANAKINKLSKNPKDRQKQSKFNCTFFSISSRRFWRQSPNSATIVASVDRPLGIAFFLILRI